MVADGPARLALGRRGEELAVRHLQRHGVVVLSRNWRAREGELDIVGTDGRTLIVCEVKTRSGVGFGSPAEGVGSEKMARIRRLTMQWLSEHHCGFVQIRFDVIAVLMIPGQRPRVDHIRGAF